MIFVNGRKGKAIRSLIYSLNYHKILDGCEIMGLRIFFVTCMQKVFLQVVTIKNLKRVSLKSLDDEFHVAISKVKVDKEL